MGFDTLDELKEDIATKLREADEQRADAEYREAVLDAVVAGATVDVPDALVDARARELWERMLHSLGHQGISKDAYLQISGKTEEEILDEAKPDAEQALRREAVIAAVIEAEDIEPSDGDVLAALQASATRESTTPEKLRERLESGRAASTSCARTSPSAPRSTTSSSTRTRSPRSGRRRATSSGRPTRAEAASRDDCLPRCELCEHAGCASALTGAWPDRRPARRDRFD